MEIIQFLFLVTLIEMKSFTSAKLGESIVRIVGKNDPKFIQNDPFAVACYFFYRNPVDIDLLWLGIK